MSPVQIYAITVLQHLEEMERAKQKTFDVKRALAARPEFKVQKMFPEYFPTKSQGLADPSETPDYSQVEWKSPKDDMKEWERLSKLLAQKAGFLSGDEVVEMPTTGEIEWSQWQ